MQSLEDTSAVLPDAYVLLCVPGKASSYLHNELFAEQWTCDTSLSYVLQVLEAALEELAVCEHTQASCTTLLICLCYL